MKELKDSEIKTSPPKKPLIFYYLAALVVLMLLNVFLFPSLLERQVVEVPYSQFLTMVDGGQVEQVALDETSREIVFIAKDDGGREGYYKTGVWPDDGQRLLAQLQAEEGITFTAEIPTQANPILSFLVSWILPIVIFIVIGELLSRWMMKRMGGLPGGMGNAMTFGKSGAKVYVEEASTGVSFADVAGQDEAKESLMEVVDFLHGPEKYAAIGAHLPKGVLLVGPPGTGKTLLAKAVAGEANVPFFSISGSDFVEMFVGMGAARVRDLFKEANKMAPCIVFIDEIDTIGKSRDNRMGGNDEREQTLNQLLVEMDGFGNNEGVVVMAATNRQDILDPALLRPGRFDRQVYVGHPDIKGREAILKVHARNKPLGDDVSLAELAKGTGGFTGADLENLMNEAAINAAKDGRKFLMQADIEKAFIKVGIGAEKKSKVISEKDKKITAYHEAGHAILFHVLPDVGPVHTVSIIPTGIGAAGYTMPLPETDDMHMTKGKMLQNIMVSLGGRIAEEIIFDDITTGASQDIKQATSIARAMVTEYGMSDKVGMINYGGDSNEVFIGRDLAHARSYGETVASTIDSEVKKIIDDCHEKAKKMILEHEDVLHKCCELLLEKEKIGQAEFEALFA